MRKKLDALEAAQAVRMGSAQVEELVKNDPEKVSAILSRWALDDLESTKVNQ